MSANRRRHINALPGLRLLMGFSVGVLLLLTGLGYVYCQNQLHRLSGEIGGLEREYEKLRTASNVVEVSIAKLSATPELKKKRDNGFFKLSEIREENIVLIGAPPKAPGAARDLRPVSNGKAKQ